MKRIRIGVAGLGRIGWSFHCKELAKHRNFELVAVADTEPARRKEAESTLHCKAFAEYRTMVSDAGLEAVVIATPTHLHRPMAEYALAAGLHVYLEKPMAPTAVDAQAIARAAQDARRILSVYQPHRAADYFQHLLRLIEMERIGRVYHVRRGCYAYVRRDDWQSQQKFGGGMLNNYGAHYLDQLLTLTGTPVSRVFCEMRRVATLGDADDVVKVVYETSDGVLGELDINMAAALPSYELEVYGSTGAIRLQNRVFTMRWFSPARLKTKALNTSLASANRLYPSEKIPFREETIPVDPACAVDVFGDLARAIRLGNKPFVPVEETVRLVELVDRCRQSSGGLRDSRLRKR